MRYIVHLFLYLLKQVEQLKAASLLHPLDIPNNKWESISMDFLISVIDTRKGHDAIWVGIDRLTKMARFIPRKSTTTTQNFTYQFINNLYWFYDLLMNIVSGRDTKFTIDFWMQTFTKLEITLSMSSTYHP